MQNEICAAIKARKVITFHYKHQNRTVEPHILGYDSDGDLTLSAWQTHGGSSQGWRDFHVSKLHGLSITGQSFDKPRQGYNPNDSTLSRIVCRGFYPDFTDSLVKCKFAC